MNIDAINTFLRRIRRNPKLVKQVLAAIEKLEGKNGPEQ